MNNRLLEELKQKLEIQKTSLEKELESFAKEDKNLEDNWDARYPNRENGNMEEEASETEEYDKLISLEHSFELKLKDTNIARERINKPHKKQAGKKDAYGICEKCGKEIEEKRLEACPEARLCMKCK